MMPRFVYSIFVFFSILTACQEADVTYPPYFPEGSVGFRVQTLQTRGSPIMGLSEVTEFKVIGYQYQGNWNNASASNPVSMYMEHISVLQGSDGVWSYSPLRYWPLDKNITFFGYAPEANVDGSPNQYGLSITTPTDGTAPVITYTVPSTVENQPDLLISTAQNYDLNKSNNGTNGVNMQLAHALTCVGFKATGEGERITGIKVSGVVGTGSLELGASSVHWDIDPGATNYEFKAGLNEQPLDENPSSLLNETGYLMMIPQVLTNNALVTITVDGGSDPYEQTFNLNIPGKEIWEPGQFVVYQFVVKATGTILLNPENLILPSAAQSYSSFSVICPEENQDLEWTVHLPDGDKFEICDSWSGTNQTSQSSPYTYSGKGSKMLYTIATETNTSGAEYTSTITLVGSSQTIGVRQLYEDEPYIPTYPHGGWAGSNIYWVPDNSYPAGGYLTFDDKEVTTHEAYQGVYFMWGSLVALSPMGTNWTGGLWNGNNGQVLYVPNPNPTTNDGWNPAINTGWGHIPRLGWSNSSFPNGAGSAIMLPNNEEQSYLIEKHKPQGNVGDICKYITDMGWAPGVKENRKWRMPTYKEYKDMNHYNKVGSNFNYKQSDNLYGLAIYNEGFRRYIGIGTPFFPLSGYRTGIFTPYGHVDNVENYRPGEAFSYWTSSPRGNQSDAFDYIKRNQGPTASQGFPRNTGSTIRCVLENDKRK